MILLIDMCYKKKSLSYYEFVKPIANIAISLKERVLIRHFLELTEDDIEGTDKAILCGTALSDNTFLNHLAEFDWILGCDISILGICAGMEVVSLVYGSQLVDKTEIGMTEIKPVKDSALFSGKEKFEAYELHSNAIKPSMELEIFAVSNNCVQAIKHTSKPFFGIMFHPEVRNEWVVERFLNL
jgi:GMP synthase (glutamine-hydrolysing)